MARISRRQFALTSLVAVPAIAVSLSVRAAQEATPPVAGTPEASPAASPSASPIAGIGSAAVSTVDIAFEPKELAIPADISVVLTITNNGVLQHDFVIDELGIRSDLLNGGESATVTITAPVGTYTYYCSVPGHREAGMEGTLTVG